MKQRLAALCMVWCLLWTVVPAKGVARPAREAETVSYINPLYAGVVTEADLLTEQAAAPARKALAPGTAPSGEESCYTSLAELLPYVRQCMTARQGTIRFSYASVQDLTSQWRTFLQKLLDEAMIHTGVPTEGDYLLWQYAGAQLSHKDQGVQEGLYRYTVTVTMTYYTTAAQEAEVDAFAKAFTARPEVASGTDYEKLCAIYDWLCKNVYYDWEHYDAQNEAWRRGESMLIYPLMYTAYGAAVDVKPAARSEKTSGYDLENVHTAVCQGYCVLFYRLALECGIDARLIAGEGNGAHAWNIAALGGQYYLLDATWDAHKALYQYFLRGSDHFPGHRPYVRETVGGHTYGDAYDYALLDVSAVDYEPGLRGDLNGDSAVTVLDLQVLFSFLDGSTAAAHARNILDVNGDGVVNILDYQALYKRIK